MTGEAFKQLMVEAAKVFGPISTWDDSTRAEVARWTKKTVDSLYGAPRQPEPAMRLVKPLWNEPELVEAGRWDDVERI